MVEFCTAGNLLKNLGGGIFSAPSSYRRCHWGAAGCSPKPRCSFLRKHGNPIAAGNGRSPFSHSSLFGPALTVPSLLPCCCLFFPPLLLSGLFVKERRAHSFLTNPQRMAAMCFFCLSDILFGGLLSLLSTQEFRVGDLPLLPSPV